MSQELTGVSSSATFQCFPFQSWTLKVRIIQESIPVGCILSACRLYPVVSQVPYILGKGTHPQKGPSNRDTHPNRKDMATEIPCKQTDTCENINFLQLRWWAVIMEVFSGLTSDWFINCFIMCCLWAFVLKFSGNFFVQSILKVSNRQSLNYLCNSEKVRLLPSRCKSTKVCPSVKSIGRLDRPRLRDFFLLSTLMH